MWKNTGGEIFPWEGWKGGDGRKVMEMGKDGER